MSCCRIHVILLFCGAIFFVQSSGQFSQSICQNVSDSSSSISLTDTIALSSSILPTLLVNSNYSNEVSVTSLSSSLVGRFGDSYGVALIGVTNDEYIQWETVDASGSVISLPDIAEPSSNPTEIQYDNRYGLFHFEKNFDTSFPKNVFLILPTEKIRFQVLQRKTAETSINLESCKSESILFVFFQIDSTISNKLNFLTGLTSHLISLNKCEKWPFSNLVFRICPDLRESTSQSATKTASTEFDRYLQSLSQETTIGGRGLTESGTTVLNSTDEKTTSQSSSQDTTGTIETISSSKATPKMIFMTLVQQTSLPTSIPDETTLTSVPLSTEKLETLGESLIPLSTVGTLPIITSEASTAPLPSTSLFNPTTQMLEDTSPSETSRIPLPSISVSYSTTQNLDETSEAARIPLTSESTSEPTESSNFLNHSTRAITTTGSTLKSSTSVSPSTAEELINCNKGNTKICNFCKKDSTKKYCYFEIEPRIFDLSESNQKFKIELDLSNPIQEIGNIECSLNNEKGESIEITTETSEDEITLEFKETFSEDALVFVSCSIDDEVFLLNQTILIASFTDLVKHQTPFVPEFNKAAQSHKSVLITFIEALPSQFSTDVDPGATCVLDGKKGKRYPAKWETPSIVTCELDSTLPTGTLNIYVIRRKELEDTTFENQTPFTITVSGNSSGNSSIISTQFMPELNGITIQLANSESLDQTFDCGKLFFGAASFGNNSICSIFNDKIEILFGTNPTITLKDQLLIRSGLISEDLSSSTVPTGGQLNVFMLSLPSNVVSPDVEIIDPGEILPCQTTVTLKSEVKSGSGNRDLVYTWKVKSGSAELEDILKTQNSSSVSLKVNELTSGDTISLEACNFVNKCSESNSISIKLVDKTSKFSVDISGIPKSPIPAMKIVMEADPTLTDCNKTIDLSMKNITYNWAINGATVTHDSVYTIPSRSYSANSFITVTLKATFWNSDSHSFMEAETSKNINFGVEPLVLVLDGGKRTVSTSNPVTIDASYSYDPNSGSRNLKHLWTCSKTSASSCSELKINLSVGKLEIPEGVLKAGETYFFTDHISNDVGATVTGQVSVEVVEAKIPSIQFVPLSDSTISSDSSLKVKALVQSSIGDLETEWHLLKSGGSEVQGSENNGDEAENVENIRVLNPEGYPTIDISSLPKVKQNFKELTPDSVFVLSFTIPSKNSSKIKDWNGLETGEYIIRLIAKNTDGSASTDFNFKVVPPISIPKLQATPIKGLSALKSILELSTNDSEIANDPVMLKFGLRTLLVGNKTEETWFRESSVNRYRTILASAWPEPHSPCNRIAYEGLLKICDLAGTCTQTETNRFVVQHPLNASQALKQTLDQVVADISSGDIDSAVQKIKMVQQEQCNNTIDSSIADTIIDKVMENLQGSTNPHDLLDGINLCTSVLSSASNPYVLKVVDLLTSTQSLLQGNPTQLEARKKRSIAMEEEIVDPDVSKVRKTRDTEIEGTLTTSDSSGTRAKRSTVDSGAVFAAMMTAASLEDNVKTLLLASDMGVQLNKDMAAFYIDNTLSCISLLCQNVDSTTILIGETRIYTAIQVENIVPSAENFLNSSYSIALNIPNSISFDSNFQQFFSSYKCGTSLELTCTDICFGSALINRQIFLDNNYIKTYFFATEFNAATLNNLISDLHLILFEDTVNAATLTLQGGASYTVLIPLNSYIVSNYYQCFVFSRGFWDSSLCTSEEYAIKTGSTSYSLTCSCKTSGIVAVFTVTPPTPPYYPPLNEIMLTFNLSTIAACTEAQKPQFRTAISSATSITANRFQNITCLPGLDLSEPARIITYLRPPFKEGQPDNSHAVQYIKRAVGVTGGLVAYGKVTITEVSTEVVKRQLRGDGNARKIPLRINKSYMEIVGNNSSSLTQKWAKTIAKTMGVDEYRIKNPFISEGIIFNFTITLPFDNEKTTASSPLSAEELSLLVMEQTHYEEIDLRDNNDQPLIVGNLSYGEIVQLVVQNPTNSLMTILAIVVSTVLLLSSFCVGGLVVLKIRTDRLIEAHNRNIRTVDIDPSGPLGLIPFESNNVVIHPTEISKQLDKAADTVVFGQNPITTRHR